MAGNEAIGQIGKYVDPQQPGKKEMPAPAFSERLISGKRNPPWKGAAGKKAIAIADHAEIAGGVDFLAADLHPADWRTLKLLFGIDRKQRRVGFIALDAP